MIELSRSGRPDKVNRKCEKCTGYCKQHANLKIVRCPSFCQGGAVKLEKC